MNQITYEEEFIRNLSMSLREKKTLRVKNYAAAKINRLTADWSTDITSPDTILRYSLRTLRARSRELIINNDYARGFLWQVAKNVAGPEGIRIQNKAKLSNNMLDTDANGKIEENWKEFNKRGNFDVTGKLSGIDADRLFIQTVARDGEIIVRFVENFDNPWLFSLQFFEADFLDESLNITNLQNGNSIRMGIEFNRWFKPVAYHLLTEHPGDYVWTWKSRQYVRIPAEQIIQPFIIERINQSRGVPWMHSAMTRLNNIGAYEEAEIVGSRIGASSMGIWEPDPNADPTTIPAQNDEAEDGSPIMEVEPGIFIKAPLGYKFNSFNPNHPSGTFGPFMKSTLRGISAGLLVSYNTLASDLESVNYSSLRAGSLEERDMWKLIQGWMILNYKAEVFRRWLRAALLTQQVRLPLSKFEQLHKPKFIPRTWAWVDPEKDMNANITALDNLLTTRSDLAAEQGEDFEEILIKLKEEQDLMKKYGVQPVQRDKKAQTAAMPSEAQQGAGNAPGNNPGEGL